MILRVTGARIVSIIGKIVVNKNLTTKIKEENMFKSTKEFDEAIVKILSIFIDDGGVKELGALEESMGQANFLSAIKRCVASRLVTGITAHEGSITDIRYSNPEITYDGLKFYEIFNNKS